MHRRHEQTNVPIEILRSLVVVLERGSFSSAATALGLTQSAVSAQMKRLRNILGDDIFLPGRSNITLTTRGTLVASFARRIVALNDQLIDDSAELRVGIPLLYSGTVLRKIVRSCRLACLGDIHYLCDTSSNLERRFEAGYLDALLALSLYPRSSACISWSEPMVWVTAKRFTHDPSKLLPWLSWPGSAEDAIAQCAFRQSGTRYKTVFVAADLASHMEAINSNLGYRLMPRRAVPQDLKIADDAFLPPASDMHVCVIVNDELAADRAMAVARCLEAAAR